MGFRFERLKIWKESVKFASEIYALTEAFPRGEQFGLISQLRKARYLLVLTHAFRNYLRTK